MAQNPYMPMMPGMAQNQVPGVQQPTMPNVPQPYVQGNGQQQRVNGFVYVNGMDGAKAFQMPPDSAMPLFDGSTPESNVMFIKTTDGAGFPTIRKIVCFEDDQEHGKDDSAIDEMSARMDALEAQIAEMRTQRGGGRTNGRSVSKAAE